MAMWPLAAEILMDCGNVMLAALNFSLIHFLKLKFYGTFTYIIQIVHSNAHLNPLKGVFSNISLIFGVILNFQFAEILDSQETWPWKVMNFSHVCTHYLNAVSSWTLH